MDTVILPDGEEFKTLEVLQKVGRHTALFFKNLELTQYALLAHAAYPVRSLMSSCRLTGSASSRSPGL